MGMEYLKSHLLTDKVHLCEDDTTAYVIGNSPDEVVAKLNRLFKEIHTWYTPLEKLKW